VTHRVFADRDEAGRLLASRLGDCDLGDDTLVLALPRGGVPIAVQVARTLGAPLDIFVVRKLGLPGRPEFAMGALASGGVVVLNPHWAELEVAEHELQEVARREQVELQRRERVYRGDRPPPVLRDRTVVVVDDGLATGSTMLAAVQALRRRGVRRLIVAVPVAPPEACAKLEAEVEEVFCLLSPEQFFAVGEWYRNFAPVTDDDVCAALAGASMAQPP
jgi:putative phosphoribosyl transferase